jgi:Zn-dependent protease
VRAAADEIVMELDLATGILWFAVFLFSTTVHEAMHALVAWKGGDPTAYHGGQVSLSPIPHIKREPIGMLAVPLLTSLTQGWAMGWASAPYDPVWAERHPKRAALMAAAGPAGNFAIALVAFVLIKIGLLAGLFTTPDSVNFSRIVTTASGDVSAITMGLSILLMFNVIAGTFNLIPLPPLDGSAVINVFLPETLAARLRDLERNGAFSMIGLLVAWRVFPLMMGPLFATVLKLVHPDASYS